MLRAIRNFILVVILSAAAAAGLIICTSHDPFYATLEIMALGRYHRYDALIRQAAARYGVDPLLVKAVIWRESRFSPGKVGRNGERGLMQVTEGAAREWARDTKQAGFTPTDLFSPRTNIEAGAWYLKKALLRYTARDDPATFALAEYNAGRSRVEKWVGDSKQGQSATAGDLRDSIAFPGTREYVDTIIERYRYYQKQGHL